MLTFHVNNCIFMIWKAQALVQKTWKKALKHQEKQQGTNSKLYCWQLGVRWGRTKQLYVGVLTFSSRLANKLKFSSVLEEPEEAKITVDWKCSLQNSYCRQMPDRKQFFLKRKEGSGECKRQRKKEKRGLFLTW